MNTKNRYSASVRTWLMLSLLVFPIGVTGCGNSSGKNSNDDQNILAWRQMWVPENTFAYIRSNMSNERAQQLLSTVTEKAKKRPSLSSVVPQTDESKAMPEVEPFDIFVTHSEGKFGFLMVISTSKSVRDFVKSMSEMVPAMPEIELTEGKNGRYSTTLPGLVLVDGNQASEINRPLLLITNNEACLSSLKHDLPPALAAELENQNQEGDLVAIVDLKKVGLTDAKDRPRELIQTEFPSALSLSFFLDDQPSVLDLKFSSPKASTAFKEIIPNRTQIEKDFGVKFNSQDDRLKAEMVLNADGVEKITDAALDMLADTLRQTRDLQTTSQLKMIYIALVRYRDQKGTWPKDLSELVDAKLISREELFSKRINGDQKNHRTTLVYLRPQSQSRTVPLDQILLYEPPEVTGGDYAFVTFGNGATLRRQSKLFKAELALQLSSPPAATKKLTNQYPSTSSGLPPGKSLFAKNANGKAPSKKEIEARLKKVFDRAEKKVELQAYANSLNQSAHKEIQRAIRTGKKITKGIRLDANNDGVVGPYEMAYGASAEIWYMNRRTNVEATIDKSCKTLKRLIDGGLGKKPLQTGRYKFKLDTNDDGKLEEVGFYAAEEWYEIYRGNRWKSHGEVPVLISPRDKKAANKKAANKKTDRSKGKENGAAKKRGTLFSPDVTQPKASDRKLK